MTHASESGHWYRRDGSPCYEVMGKSGMRAATLRDARVMGLLPGVSSILSMEAKPQLTKWLIEQALMSAITLPRHPGECDDVFKERALADSKAQAIKARDEGTRIHAVIQGAFEGQTVDPKDVVYVRAVRAALDARYGPGAWEAEKSFGHPSGYGGKADLVRPRIVGDIKTKDFTAEKWGKDLAWPENGMQLAAYADGFGIENPDCVNIFVSTRVPGLVRLREWDAKEIKEAREAFGLLLRLWKLRRGYDPSFNPQEVAA